MTQTAQASGAGRPVVVFLIDGQRYAVDLQAVERVVPMVAISPLPNGPDVVLGVINVHGEVLAVVEARRRLGLPTRELGPLDRLLVAKAGRRTVALPVDEVSGVAEVTGERIARPDAVVPGIARVAGIAALPDGLMLIHDLDAFLSLEEERQLEQALAEASS